MTALPQHLLDIVPNAVHVHSRANLPERDCQGDQTLGQIIHSARGLGMSEVYLTEHTTNPQPGKPHVFRAGDELGQAIRNRFDDVQMVAEDLEYNLFPGIEINILAEGVDAPRLVMTEAALVVASMHGHVPESGEEVTGRLCDTAENPLVSMLGHAQRWVNVFDVDWHQVFDWAADLNQPTLVEANFNAWFNYGPGKLRRKGELDAAASAHAQERHFYEELARSAAPVAVSLDIHSDGMWPSKDPVNYYDPSFQDLEDFLDLLFGCGITPERIMNRSLREWLLLPKSDRGKLMSWM